jgi:hypothetical protein
MTAKQISDLAAESIVFQELLNMKDKQWEECLERKNREFQTILSKKQEEINKMEEGLRNNGFLIAGLIMAFVTVCVCFVASIV